LFYKNEKPIVEQNSIGFAPQNAEKIGPQNRNGTAIVMQAAKNNDDKSE